MATFFYESMWDVCTFAVLQCVLYKKHRHGDALLLYMLCYGAGRMVIESFRMDSLMSFTNTFRVSALLSGMLCLFAAGIFSYRCKKMEGMFVLGGGIIGLLAVMLTSHRGLCIVFAVCILCIGIVDFVRYQQKEKNGLCQQLT